MCEPGTPQAKPGPCPKGEDSAGTAAKKGATRRELVKTHKSSGTVGLSSDEIREKYKAIQIAPHQDEFLNTIWGSSNLGQLEPDVRIRHAYAVQRVAAKLTPKAAARMSKHLGRVAAVADVTEATALFDKADHFKTRPKDFEVQGFYDTRSGQMVVDGLSEHEGKSDPEDVQRAVWSHELTHALDGPKFEFSKSTEWQDAFAAEIAGEQLSVYAATSAVEGLAEFGRCVYGTDIPDAKIQKLFPRCHAFFKKRGLL